MKLLPTDEGFVFTSKDTLVWQRHRQAKPTGTIPLNQEAYNDYRFTRLQWEITDPENLPLIATYELHVSVIHRLSSIHVTHANVFWQHPQTLEWTPIPHTFDETTQTIQLQTNKLGHFAIAVNHYWYSSFTQRLADEYPNWTAIRQDKESNGQKFLNFFGIELETVEHYLEWIGKQKYLTTVDLNVYDWIYCYPVGVSLETSSITVYAKSDHKRTLLPQLENLSSFFFNDQDGGGIWDSGEKKWYSAVDYGTIVVQGVINGKHQLIQADPIPFHVWNALDEFGLLFGVERLFLETNADYQQRLLDVFRYPSGTHEQGLIHGIARDLGLIESMDKNNQALLWKDDFKSFVLKNTSGKTIHPSTIQVDGHFLTEEEYSVDLVGKITIHPKKTGMTHQVRVITGVEVYALYDQSNPTLHSFLYETNGQATPTFIRWVSYINTVAPVMWDYVVWDEGFWDTIDESLTGIGYLPNQWDTSLDVWKNYTFDSIY